MSDGSQRKAPSSKKNPNHDICEFLMELSTYERNVGRNIYKSNAYRTAATSLASYPTRITSGKEAASVKGVGKKISEKIDEFLSTGKLEKLEKIRNDSTSTAINELIRVTGIGPAKARELYDAGITTLSQLREQQELLNHHQQIGLKYVSELEERIPRSEVQAIETALLASLTKVPYQCHVTICGSYRRGCESCGDVDVLLTIDQDGKKCAMKYDTKHNTPGNTYKKQKLNDDSLSKKGKGSQSPASSADSCGGQNTDGELLAIVRQLEQDGIVTDRLSLGKTKFMGVCNVPGGACHRRLDIRLLQPEQYHCGVLYFTGSDLFNMNLRASALAAGFTINEYSIRPVGSTGTPGEPLPVTREEDVFDYIGVPYTKPQDRNL